MRMLSFAATACAAVLTIIVAVPAATAHFDTGYYTHSGCPGTSDNRVDPINIYFWDWGTIGRSENNLELHVGMTNQDGSSQTFVDHGNCYDMAGQRADGCAVCQRAHIRLHPIHYDDYIGWTTVGDAHYEWWSSAADCFKHVTFANGSFPGIGGTGSGFDLGRYFIRVNMEAGGHSWLSVWWGNTENRRQCNGDYARSDGYTVGVRVHQLFH